MIINYKNKLNILLRYKFFFFFLIVNFSSILLLLPIITSLRIHIRDKNSNNNKKYSS